MALPGLPGGTVVPWSGKGHPYAIGVVFNEDNCCFEVVIQIGAFRTQAEAEMATHLLAPQIKQMLGGTQEPANTGKAS